MNDMAKVIRSGDGQAVELPEEYWFDGAEVRVSREGHRIVLESIEGGPYDPDAIDPETGLTFGEVDALVQEGLDSGPDEPLDMDGIKREARAVFEAEHRR